VIEVLPIRVVFVKNDTRSPTNTGCLNTTLSIDTVTIRPGCDLCASIAAARSTCERITPPKIVPTAFVSRGIITWRIDGTLSRGVDEIVHAPFPSARSA
jgi:hypothetical protein